MATREETLNVARSFLGEGPDRFVRWYPAPLGTPWCAIFQSYVLTATGQPLRYAYVTYMFNAYRNEGRCSTDTRSAQPGDLVAFDYDGGGRNNYDHIAIVESLGRDSGGDFMVCIDGNWQNRVQRVKRYFDRSGYGGGIAEIARPFYSSPTPTPTPDGDDSDMKSVIMIDHRYNPPRAFHACGNSKVALTRWEQVTTLQFLGVQLVDPAPADWLDALATLPRNDGAV